MKLKAQGFLLFTFAFSSVLAFPEPSEKPVKVKNAKSISKSTSASLNGERSTPEKNNPAVKVSELDHGLEKRSAEVFTGTFSGEGTKKQEPYEPNFVMEADHPDKRARLGFTGMRGKKEFSADEYCARNLRARLEGALNKRFLTNINEMLGGKRASLAFHGMRGKKSWDYENEILDPEAFDSSPPQEFLMRIGLVDEGEGEGPERKSSEESEGEEGEGEGLSKRSPYAFQGMRGKKEYAYDLKRAMGFLGMRGKKGSEFWSSDNKRAPQPSFFGMKGKKAQSSGFFGMRGKKASPNAFFGIKGKREPLGYDVQDFSQLNQLRESGSSSNRFRRGITWLNNSKKAKNAFFGIRGKKTTPEGHRRSPVSELQEGPRVRPKVWPASPAPVRLRPVFTLPLRSGLRHRRKMRFRFCGDLDCPDWVLAEINTLSKMSSIKVKMLCQIVAKSLIGNEFDEEKAKKLVLDSKLDEDDMKACVAALSSVFNSSARYAVEEDVLGNELQQLGLPKEHATALCKVYSEHLTRLTEDLEKRSFRTSALESASCSVRDLGKENIELSLRIDDRIRGVTSTDVIEMTSEQLALLLTDLKTARDEMKSLSS